MEKTVGTLPLTTNVVLMPKDHYHSGQVLEREGELERRQLVVVVESTRVADVGSAQAATRIEPQVVIELNNGTPVVVVPSLVLVEGMGVLDV